MTNYANQFTQATDANGVEHLDIVNNTVSALITASRNSTASSIDITSNLEKELDKASFNSYNTSDLWWWLAVSNSIYDPFTRPSEGEVLRVVPRSVLTAFNTSNTRTRSTTEI